MFTVLFSDTSYNRLGVRLFLYPPSKPGGEPPLRPRGEGPKGKGPRNRESEKQKYRTEAVLIADLGVAISWAKNPENLEQASAFSLELWKDSLIKVKQGADKLLTGLENLELPDDLKTHAKELLAKAEVLRNCLAQILPEDVQAILNSRVQALEKSRTGLKSLVQAILKKLRTLNSRVQAIFKKSRTDLKQEDLNDELQILLSLKEELPILIEELPGKLEEVKNLLSRKLQ